MIHSVCIPRAKYFVTVEMVTEVFSTIFGKDLIQKVDRVERTDTNTGEGFWVIFIHFETDEEYSQLEEFMNRIETQGEVKVIYQANWFWKVRKSNSKPKPRNGPRIMTVEDEEAFKEYQKNFLQGNKVENTEPED